MKLSLVDSRSQSGCLQPKVQCIFNPTGDDSAITAGDSKHALWCVNAVQAETNRPRPRSPPRQCHCKSYGLDSELMMPPPGIADDRERLHVRQGRCDGMPAPQLHPVRVRPGKLLSYQGAPCAHAARPCGHRPVPRDAWDPASSDSDLAYTCSKHWQPEGREAQAQATERSGECPVPRTVTGAPAALAVMVPRATAPAQRPTLAVSTMRASVVLVVASNVTCAGVRFQLCPACPLGTPPFSRGQPCTWVAPLDLPKLAPRALLVSSSLFFLSR